MNTLSHRHRRGAFTLVEMITVVGIVSLLIALAAPALIDVVRSTRLNSAGDALVNRMSLAQQSAVSLSSEVEIRFYKYVDTDGDKPNENLFYAYQVVKTEPDGTQKAISDPYFLESGIVISGQPELSPLLTTTITQPPQSSGGAYLFNPPGNTSANEVTYAAMRFYPDGSMRMLNSSTDPGDSAADVATAYTIPQFDSSFLILVESRDSLSTQAPSNYYCVQIDSYTGRTRVYR